MSEREKGERGRALVNGVSCGCVFVICQTLASDTLLPVRSMVSIRSGDMQPSTVGEGRNFPAFSSERTHDWCAFCLCTHGTDLRRTLWPARTAGAQNERNSVHLTRYSLTHGTPRSTLSTYSMLRLIPNKPSPCFYQPTVVPRNYYGGPC